MFLKTCGSSHCNTILQYQKPGHCANECRKKKYDCTQTRGSGGNQHDTNVKTADLINLSGVTAEQITDTLQSKTFLEMEDDEKLKIIEKITPQGF